MKYSAFLAGCGAVMAAASPILQDRKLYIKTDVVVEWITVTVTEGDVATVFRRPQRVKPTTTSIAPAPSSTSVAPPPPPPPSSTTPVVVIQPTPTPTPSPKASPQPEVESNPPVVKVPQSSSAAAPPPPAATKPVEVAQPTDYTSTALHHHNVHRFNHSAGALEWSDQHAGYAKTLAERCVFEHDTGIGGGGYGQNLAMWGSSGNIKTVPASDSIAKAASDGWYNNELMDYPAGDFGKDSPNMANFHKWGHFSQMVWKGSKQVGCATHFCEAGTLSPYGSWYTVCNYFPAGNMGGAYGKNVLPPLGQATVKAA